MEMDILTPDNNNILTSSQIERREKNLFTMNELEQRELVPTHALYTVNFVINHKLMILHFTNIIIK